MTVQGLRLLHFVVQGTAPPDGMVAVRADVEPVLEERRSERRAAPSSATSPAPSALGGGWRRALELLYLLAVTDFKKHYFGTVFGYLWSIARPLLLFGVLLAVFTQVFRLGSEVPHYPVLLLFNIVLFGFFQEATGAAVTSIVAQEGIVRKTQFPRLVIPLAVVLTSLFNLGLNLVVVLVFIARLRRRADVDVAPAPADRRGADRDHDRGRR